jgi:CheY-like chemotaxis protein
VLYIEDDPVNIRLIQRALTQRPQTHLLTAQNAHDGIRTATTEQPALILLDNRLPDATGKEVLRQLSATDSTAGIPVIMMSGDSGKDTIQSLLALGASDFLTKPIDLNHLLTIIDQYLSLLPPGINGAWRIHAIETGLCDGIAPASVIFDGQSVW